MSPRIAFTTACSDSPSKLNVAAPLLPPRFGGGAEAALRLMTWPEPRLICAVGAPVVGSTPGGNAVVCVPLASVIVVGNCVCTVGVRPSREILATGGVAQPANATAVAAITSVAMLVRRVMARSLVIAPGSWSTRSSICFGLRWWLLLRVLLLLPRRFFAQLRASLFDALADRLHLRLGRHRRIRQRGAGLRRFDVRVRGRLGFGGGFGRRRHGLVGVLHLHGHGHRGGARRRARRRDTALAVERAQ